MKLSGVNYFDPAPQRSRFTRSSIPRLASRRGAHSNMGERRSWRTSGLPLWIRLLHIPLEIPVGARPRRWPPYCAHGLQRPRCLDPWLSSETTIDQNPKP